jgi:hypothetical protein
MRKISEEDFGMITNRQGAATDRMGNASPGVHVMSALRLFLFSSLAVLILKGQRIHPVHPYD